MFFIHDKNALKKSTLSLFSNVMKREVKQFKFCLRTFYTLEELNYFEQYYSLKTLHFKLNNLIQEFKILILIELSIIYNTQGENTRICTPVT